MSTSGSKSNEHVAHFLVDIHILSAKQEAHVSPEESNHKAKGITRGADFYRRKSND